MSIYASLWEIKIEKPWAGFRKVDLDDPLSDTHWLEVYAQAVPGHIGHPEEYPDGDPYADFLPPAIEDQDKFRAVVILVEGRDEKKGQQYVSPLLLLTGEEYQAIGFADMLERIDQALWACGLGDEYDGDTQPVKAAL